MDSITKNLISKIPKEVSHVTNTLEKAGFEAYLVGGCVRDLLMDKIPNDWDVTTNAKPEQIIGLFEKTVYENTFGTVAVVVSRETLGTSPQPSPCKGEGEIQDVIRETSHNFIIEVTPYRTEAKYSDFRHPDEVKFSDKLEDDLKRRDFTVNAMALSPKGHLVDLFDGIKDIKDKTLKAVGDPDDRFAEDALRMLRAVRFSCQLNFFIAQETTESILKNSELIKKISEERIRDEFVKITTSANASSGVLMLQKFNLLKNIIPELLEGVDCEQGGEHIYDVWNHSLLALQHAANKNWSLEIRLAALFHDIGKPRARRLAGKQDGEINSAFSGSLSVRARTALPLGSSACETPRESKFISPSSSLKAKKKFTFYGHEVVGARMAKKIMERLKFPKKEIELVSKLVRNHMFFSDTELITLSAVRRIITKVGKENIWLLMDVRECDRVGMKKKEAPYRLRKYFAMIEEALRDPISVGQLKINGEFMIKELGITSGPRMGWILHALLEEVLDAPEKNTVEHLSELVKSLNMLGDAELKTLGLRGKEKKEELEEEEVKKLHTKHGVK
ncbi:MAG: HD domain-containing protein [Candidatus Pacebacteria bacterium]|nr:HD domain-containing protein [Candidatus Paceibacterota bacterium]